MKAATREKVKNLKSACQQNLALPGRSGPNIRRAVSPAAMVLKVGTGK